MNGAAALHNKLDHSSPDLARALRRRRLGVFFLAAWTVFAAFAVWWLVRQSGAAINSDWILEGDALSNASLAERLGNWFSLLDLNFHALYPFILLVPYVVWLAARFHLEQGRWRVSLPVHLAGCALFMVLSHMLAARIGSDKRVIIAVKSEARVTLDGNHEVVTTTSITNLLTNLINAPPLPAPEALGGGPADQISRTNPITGFVGGGVALSGVSGEGQHTFLFARRWSSELFWDLLHLFGYASVVGLVHAVHFYDRSRERERRASALESQLTQARLNALQAQLHPHFLFNALNAISTLLRRDTRAAQDALTSFSELLRLALSHSSQPEVSLREYVEFLRRYVEIQQTRLGDRFRFEEEIDPSAWDNLVPALLLQPLVENSIRHGIEPSPDPGVVHVSVHPNGGRLLVTVEDNGAGLSKEDERSAGMGIGLQNLRSRLETLYGDQQRLEVGTRHGGGVTVRIEFPLRQARALEPTASLS